MLAAAMAMAAPRQDFEQRWRGLAVERSEEYEHLYFDASIVPKRFKSAVRSN